MTHWIISTDLDGTLLDHHTYSYQSAMPAIKKSLSKGIPIIFNTSKTLPETIDVQKEIGVSSPFIIENGAAVYLPKTLYRELTDHIKSKSCREDYQYFYNSLGIKREKILDHLSKLKTEFNYDFTGFSELSDKQLMALTGLELIQAQNAKARSFSEPVIWEDSAVQLKNFKMQLKQVGLKVLKGGRFYHIQGHNNKGKALIWLKNLYQKFYHNIDASYDVKVIALGDSENDVDMLNCSDIPVIIRSNNHKAPSVNHKQQIISNNIGPLGWNNEVLNILNKQKT
ncbi:MAG: HAD-IIB family hydrolase [Gammaproteobacteria bacterium]|nr:HAD-IIB family hydrolase [Gammaproteobacteria bacterium]